MSNLQHCTSLQNATGEVEFRLTNDCMFHVVFQKNPKALLGLCAALLHMHPEEIRSVEVLNPFEFKTIPTDKTFVLDLKVMLNDDSILNFEVQVVDEKDWPERSLTYACRSFDQLKKGESYLDVKPVRHIGFLDYNLKGFTPEFYATYQLLNIKNHEIYTGKFALSVVNLNQIELATEEDRKYGVDHWARLFKATTWEAIKKMAQENEYISSAAETMFESSQDESMRYFLEGVEEANRIRRGQEIRIERAEAALARKEALIADKEATIVEKDKVIAEMEAELTRLRALLENK
ncbi:MAG: Rpn family recombination-promoting nuclease/putative transposase [Lachnospiraceae bacterium]|nr:Rpn family recombination-promoting nuclease/putative transposase [Lachnospiraceae bacterium]MBQ8546999.1 Rpn family recombination-promoting nuclease/putative transposase [Lachnospiraceae bacterium]MBQ8846685.1 Rpn family recombination-promoting nuclease/putative transposase [Lachnospiraceae bacterium]